MFAREYLTGTEYGPTLAHMDLNPQNIAKWFREQARRFNDIADTLDGTFASGNMLPTNGVRARTRVVLDAELIQKMVKKRGHRVSDLARALDAQPEQIRDIIEEPGSGLKIIPRGWVKATEDYEVSPTAQREMIAPD